MRIAADLSRINMPNLPKNEYNSDLSITALLGGGGWKERGGLGEFSCRVLDRTVVGAGARYEK